MRKLLSEKEGERKRFMATFSRVGKKKNFNGYAEDTILLTDIKDVDTGEVLTSHIWFTYSKGFEKLSLKPGMIISFEARVKLYTKGYVNRSLGMNRRSVDFKLSHPTKIMEVKS